MTAVDPSFSLVALGFCLFILAAGAGVVVALVSQARSGRISRRQLSSPPARPGGTASAPDHRPNKGSLWVEPREDDMALDEDVGSAAVDLPYTRRRYLLTQAEREFFAVLRAAVPEGWYAFPQVRLANLVMLKKGTRNWKPHYSRVAQKCVDFVVCDAARIGPRLVVELDDSSHNRPDRQARDSFVDAALAAAGLPILHVRWQRRYDAAILAGRSGSRLGYHLCLTNCPWLPT